MDKILAKHLAEIRFSPNAKILDKRGEIAESLSNATFTVWNISNNRIDFASRENKNIEAFFSYKNLGVVSSSPNEKQFFLDEAKAFIKSAWTFFPFDKITRIGIRSTFIIPVTSLTEAFEAYKKKFLKLEASEISKFDGDLVDVGFPLNFVKGDDFFNVMTGPMDKEQAKQFFGDDDQLPESAIYIDVDYFRKDLSVHLTQKNVLELLEQGVKKAKDIADTITAWIKTT